MPVTVNIRRLEAHEVELQGEVPVEELGLNSPDELVHVHQPLRYRLTAHKTGEDILVKGDLDMVLTCDCARCLKPFKYTMALRDWMVHVPLEGEEKAEIKDDCIDLTPYLREDILLEYPQHPLCDADCAGLPNRAEKTNAKQRKGAAQTLGSSVWSELNKLKF